MGDSELRGRRIGGLRLRVTPHAAAQPNVTICYRLVWYITHGPAPHGIPTVPCLLRPGQRPTYASPAGYKGVPAPSRSQVTFFSNTFYILYTA